MAARYLGWPNRITIARLLLVGPFFVCLLNLNEPGRAGFRWLSLGVFALMAISDMFDGFLARRLNDESPLGRFLDPVADKVLITVAMLFFGIAGIRDPSLVRPPVLLPDWAVVAAIGKDLVVCLGFAVVYLATGRVFIEPRRLGKLCTTMQLTLVLAILLAFDLPSWLADLPRWLWTLASGVAMLATLDYIVLGVRFVATVAPSAGKSPRDP